jgi:hypothetical protein
MPALKEIFLTIFSHQLQRICLKTLLRLFQDIKIVSAKEGCEKQPFIDKHDIDVLRIQVTKIRSNG